VLTVLVIAYIVLMDLLALSVKIIITSTRMVDAPYNVIQGILRTPALLGPANPAI